MGASLYLSPSRLSLVLTPAAAETGNYCPFLEHDEGKGRKLVLYVQCKEFCFSLSFTKRHTKHYGTSTPGNTWALYHQHTFTHLSPMTSFVPTAAQCPGVSGMGCPRGVRCSGVSLGVRYQHLTSQPPLALLPSSLSSFFLASHFPHSPRRQLRSSQPLHGYSHAASRLSRYLIRGF